MDSALDLARQGIPQPYYMDIGGKWLDKLEDEKKKPVEPIVKQKVKDERSIDYAAKKVEELARTYRKVQVVICHHDKNGKPH